MPIHIKKPVQLIASAVAAVKAAVAPPAMTLKPGSKVILKSHGVKPNTPVSKPAPAPVATPAPTVAKTGLKPPIKPVLKPSIKPLLKPPSLKPSTTQATSHGVLGLKPLKPASSPQAAEPEVKVSPTAGMSQMEQAAALAAGLITHADLHYEQVGVKDRVIIVNDLFPWVKHYKPGDRGYITKAANPIKDPLGLDDAGVAMWVIHIDQPTDKSRMGQTAALFRKEFQLDTGAGITNVPGKKVLMGE